MGERRGAHRVMVGKSERQTTWEDLGVDGRVILLIFNKQDRGEKWIDLAQDRDKLSALISAVLNLWVPKNAENF